MEKTAERLRREHIALEGDTHGKNKWAILFTVLVMTFMACLDASIVTVALPVMQKELGVGLDRIQLVSSVYLLATCVAMLPFGRLGDVRGKVNVFQLGVIVFTGGSLLCGLSASLEVLILARFVQGIGCAAAMANIMGIITESFPARERGRAMGILATFVALGMMCGPVLGGVLVASFSWESIFLINLHARHKPQKFADHRQFRYILRKHRRHMHHQGKTSRRGRKADQPFHHPPGFLRLFLSLSNRLFYPCVQLGRKRLILIFLFGLYPRFLHCLHLLFQLCF